MNSKIDLTQNRIFNKNRFDWNSGILISIGRILSKNKYGWDFWDNYKLPSMISKRNNDKLSEEGISICDRCGKRIYGWNKVYDLCNKCDSDIEESKNWKLE